MQKNPMKNIEPAAMKLLEHPELYQPLPKRQSVDIKLLLWEYPAFDPYRSWALFRGKDDCFVRRITWGRPGDLRPGATEPTMYGAEAKVPIGHGDRILQGLTEIRVPAFIPEKVIGLDGVTYGLRTGDSYRSARVEWWCEAPTEWRELETWFHETKDSFEFLLPESTAG